MTMISKLIEIGYRIELSEANFPRQLAAKELVLFFFSLTCSLFTLRPAHCPLPSNPLPTTLSPILPSPSPLFKVDLLEESSL